MINSSTAPAARPAVAAPTGLALPELLAPAGDWDCVRAAVENGADAIYFGLSRFNARMRAQNFTEADLPSLMEFLHLRGVRGYVTFNTLVFANELEEAQDYLRSVISAGVDAAIVQDVGICRLIRQISPDFPIHASTQMTVTSAAGVEFARELGCQLVVLARECSIAEIEKIRDAAGSSASGASTSLPMEVFVHGALCVAYSGQCLTSEALGGRSANRGECAQACRLPYDLISDGRQIPLGDRRYLLSPQDLAGIEVLPDLVRAGVASLKIEGRLKSPGYVANITRVYRQAIDRMARGEELIPGQVASKAENYDLEMGFSRGLYTGWFRGIHNQELVHARFGRKRGVYLGEVSRVGREDVLMRLESPLKPGDGVVFDAGTPEQPEEGGRVYHVDPAGRTAPGDGSAGLVLLKFGPGAVDFRRIQPGHKVWKTSDPELEKRVRQTYDVETPQHRRPLRVEVHGRLGAPLTIVVRDEQGHVVQLSSQMPLAEAQSRPLTEELLLNQLGRLGGTPFTLGTLKADLVGNLLLPVSELNRLRRDAVAQLEALRRQPLRWTLNPAAPTPPESKAPGDHTLAELVVLVRNIAQLDMAIEMGIPNLYCEFEDPKKYRDAVARFREARGPSSSSSGSLFVAPPRITKMGEEWILNLVRSSQADGYLVRNHDHLKFFEDCRRVGDFSLNVANAWTAQYFFERFGLESLTASYDLNFEQLSALLESYPAGRMEVTIHQHMPMFHMEHCVFCAFMSKGRDFHDCGRPCEKHDVRLRDRVGMEHPLKADAGCRNTVFNAQAQTGAEYVGRMQDLGVRRFRLEFMNESPAVLKTTVLAYQRLLRGEITGQSLWRELNLRAQLGVTRGQMERAER